METRDVYSKVSALNCYLKVTHLLPVLDLSQELNALVEKTTEIPKYSWLSGKLGKDIVFKPGRASR